MRSMRNQLNLDSLHDADSHVLYGQRLNTFKMSFSFQSQGRKGAEAARVQLQLNDHSDPQMTTLPSNNTEKCTVTTTFTWHPSTRLITWIGVRLKSRANFLFPHQLNTESPVGATWLLQCKTWGEGWRDQESQNYSNNRLNQALNQPGPPCLTDQVSMDWLQGKFSRFK